MLKLDEVPEKLNIIGGGILACEIANIYSKLGSEVSVIARSQFLKEIGQNTREYVLKNILQDINIYENTSVTEIT